MYHYSLLCAWIDLPCSLLAVGLLVYWLVTHPSPTSCSAFRQHCTWAVTMSSEVQEYFLTDIVEKAHFPHFVNLCSGYLGYYVRHRSLCSHFYELLAYLSSLALPVSVYTCPSKNYTSLSHNLCSQRAHFVPTSQWERPYVLVGQRASDTT